MTIRIHHAEALEWLRTQETNSADGLLCDPPYGFSFMGKAWDYDVPSVDLWRECRRVLKPGAPLLAFGGARTFHRICLGIEDAGFELRDVLMWLYGAGFPKSLDIGKGIDKAAGATREVVGHRPQFPDGTRGARPRLDKNASTSSMRSGLPDPGGMVPITAPATDLAREWDGYGTALKPAWESVTFARKPEDIQTIVSQALDLLTEATCRLASIATGAASSSECNLSALEPRGSALWSAVAASNTPAALCAVMATLPSASAPPLSLSIVSSWLRTLVEVSQLESTCTTETASSLTTDLKTLRSSLSTLTPGIIIEVATRQRGMTPRALLVASSFDAVSSRLGIIRACSAGAPVTSTANDEGLRPNYEPVILARKPLVGTMVANVKAWGVGGINIDASRISTDDDLNGGAYSGDLRRREEYAPTDAAASASLSRLNRGAGEFRQPGGRWPSNVVLDEHAAAVLDAEVGDRPGMSGGGKHKPDYPGGMFGGIDSTHTARGDSGGPSRYFYTSKVATCEREFGCEEQGVASIHPTMKPLSLTQWLATLILPPARKDGTPRRLLNPFAGSGSEAIGAMRAGWDVIDAIERDNDYVKILAARVKRWSEVPKHIEPKKAVAAEGDVDPRQLAMFGKVGT